jgi:hypothetical protein
MSSQFDDDRPNLPDEAWYFIRCLKLQAKALAGMIDFCDVNEANVVRASGAAICDTCHLPLHDHPHIEKLAAVVTCDGRLCHL